MTPADLDRRFGAAVADADRTLLSEGRVAPAFLVVGRDDRAQFMVADFSSQEGKAASFALARLTAIADDAVLVAHRSEAWIVVGGPTPGVAPSRSDRRREVVLVLAAARGDDGAVLTRLSAREIVRGDDGAPVETRPVNLPDDTALTSSLGDLLPPTPPAPAERRAARIALARAAKRMARGKAAFVQQ